MSLVDHIRRVPVELGERSYNILIGAGILDDVAQHLRNLAGVGRTHQRRIHVVTDENVYGLYKDVLYRFDQDVSVTVLPAGESQKSFLVLQKLLDDVFAQKLTRNDILAAFGGGVIGDLTGFAASIYKRGCRFVQIPTTLLAQVDSSVGGKTAINVAQGKNLVGAFYQPELVIADTNVLKTLPERELKAGYAEVLKYGLLGNRDFYDWLENNGSHVLALQPDAVEEAIATSCMMKAAIVAEDEREKGARALLNLGHTFGHALEAEAGYGSDLLHGEAVSAGMQMAFEYSAAQGLCDQKDALRLAQHLSDKGLTGIAETGRWLSSPDALMAHMAQDKKNEAGQLTLILARAIGDAFVEKSVSVQSVRNYLQSLI